MGGIIFFYWSPEGHLELRLELLELWDRVKAHSRQGPSPETLTKHCGAQKLLPSTLLRRLLLYCGAVKQRWAN